MNDIQDKLNNINRSQADAAKQKFLSCFSRNKRFKAMCEISRVLEGEDLVDSEDLKDLSVSDIVCNKYARLLSCDVERTFSQYKSLFRDNRQRFTTHSLKMTFVVQCNNASLSV
jgi:hypothetical protein